jgi:hypothetical protein
MGMSGSWRGLALVFPVLLCGAAFGQELHLKSGDVYTGSAAGIASSGTATWRRPEAGLRNRGPEGAHRIIQFDHLPGVEDLDALLAAGFKVIAAVPDNAVMVVAQSRNAMTTRIAGVRWTGELQPADKLSPELLAASPRDPVLALIEFHTDVLPERQHEILSGDGVSVVSSAVLLSNHVVVRASLDKLRALAANDEVAYIFRADSALAVVAAAASELMPCAGMLTLAGPIAQYANIVHGWDLDSDHAAHLGYAFGTMTTKVPALTAEAEILRALNTWSMVTNLIFEARSNPAGTRTIQIKFATRAHGDAYPFDGPGGFLGHTFYPVPVNAESIAGDIHLDADENWHAGGDLDIYSVALHEIGHALGLGHSDKPGDVMYPYYRRGMQLSSNDIGAIRTLYGFPGNAAASPAPITLAPPVAPALKITLNPITPVGQSAQTTISGTVSGGAPPLTLQYQTDRGYNGKAAVSLSGTWTATGVGLATGLNTVTVTAFDAARQTASQSAVVTRAASQATAGTAPVSVKISSPASAVTTAKASTISLGGTSSGGAGVTQVAWQSSTGAAGTAAGTDHWLAADIPLLTGTNTIIVRAFDASGAGGWATIIVMRP